MRAIAMSKTVGADGFVNAAGFKNRFNSFLYAASIHDNGSRLSHGCVHASRKDELRVFVALPVLS